MKILVMFIFLAIVGYFIVAFMGSPYLDENNVLVVADKHKICETARQCQLVTDTYAGCNYRLSANSSAASYDVAKFYRYLRDTIMRSKPDNRDDCVMPTQGVPNCVDNICIIDPDAPQNSYF
jgi:hypothetical protein